VLEALRTGPLASARYRYAAIAPAEGGPFSVCALSRIPFASVSCHYAATPAGRAGRDILELELEAGGRRLMVLVCHWKSKSEGAEATEEARREAATLVSDLVSARLSADPGAAIVVCGDLNESPDEYARVGRRYPTALMPVEDPAAAGGRNAGLGRLLVASSISATHAFGREPVLFSPWQESGGYSYSYKGSRERLDNFLLSPGLLDPSRLSYKYFSVASAAFLLDSEGSPAAWPGTGASGYSDHLPILLVLAAAGD
jgi:exonuclease III